MTNQIHDRCLEQQRGIATKRFERQESCNDDASASSVSNEQIHIHWQVGGMQPRLLHDSSDKRIVVIYEFCSSI